MYFILKIVQENVWEYESMNTLHEELYLDKATSKKFLCFYSSISILQTLEKSYPNHYHVLYYTSNKPIN